MYSYLVSPHLTRLTCTPSPYSYVSYRRYSNSNTGFCQCFPNYVFYRWVVHDVFKYEKHTDGGFTYSIADDHLIWGPAYGLWNASVNRGAGSSKPIPQDEPATRFPVWDSPKTIPCSYEPDIPFAPDYKSVPGLISDGIFRRIDIPRSHTNGYV